MNDPKVYTPCPDCNGKGVTYGGYQDMVSYPCRTCVSEGRLEKLPDGTLVNIYGEQFEWVGEVEK